MAVFTVHKSSIFPIRKSFGLNPKMQMSLMYYEHLFDGGRINLTSLCADIVVVRKGYYITQQTQAFRSFHKS